MGNEERLNKTMTAVRGCIRECLQSAAPFAALDRYVDNLRRNPQWAESEITEVETTARRAIEAAWRNRQAW
jgi:hypothetical protein